MDEVGRQGQRFGAAGVHHQRQYSDNFLETSSNRRWFQSAGLQHLQSSSKSSSPPPQDYGFYGGGGGGPPSRVYRNAQRGYNEFYAEAPSKRPYNATRPRVSREPEEEEETRRRWETSLRAAKESASWGFFNERRCCRREERMRCCGRRRGEAWDWIFLGLGFCR